MDFGVGWIAHYVDQVQCSMWLTLKVPCAQAERRALRRVSTFRARQHNPPSGGFPSWDVGLLAPLPAELADRNFQRNRRLGENRPYLGGAPYMLIKLN